MKKIILVLLIMFFSFSAYAIIENNMYFADSDKSAFLYLFICYEDNKPYIVIANDSNNNFGLKPLECIYKFSNSNKIDTLLYPEENGNVLQFKDYKTFIKNINGSNSLTVMIKDYNGKWIVLNFKTNDLQDYFNSKRS